MSKPPSHPQEQAKCSPFALYIGEKLANLDKRNRMIAEKKITDVIYEIEINSSEMITVVTAPQQPQTPQMDFMTRQSCSTPYQSNNSYMSILNDNNLRYMEQLTKKIVFLSE